MALAACIGAVLGDLARQGITGEKGRVLFRTSDGNWTVTTPPQVLIPAVLAGFPGTKWGVLRAAASAALIAGWTARR